MRNRARSRGRRTDPIAQSLRQSAASPCETEVFADSGYSANDPERPAFSRLKDLVSKGEIGAVISKNCDRLARRHTDSREFCKLCSENGVKVIIIGDPDFENSVGLFASYADLL